MKTFQNYTKIKYFSYSSGKFIEKCISFDEMYEYEKIFSHKSEKERKMYNNSVKSWIKMQLIIND